MSHAGQLGFIAACVDANRELVHGASVLEVGSYDVNGSVRRLFAAADRYLGVDLVQGPGVDVVVAGKDYNSSDGSFDVTLSGECFEHDEDWRETFAAMVRLTRPGGLVVFTCASRGRIEHGTRRTTASESPGTQALGSDYYRNVLPIEVAALPLEAWFEESAMHFAPGPADLYFCGIRAGECGVKLGGRLPDPSAVRDLARLVPSRMRIVQAPARLLSRVVSDQRRFQDLATRYWAAILKGAQLMKRAPGRGPSR